MRRAHRLVLTAVSVTAVAAATAVPTAGVASTDTDALLQSYTADTWRSMAAMVHPETGLAADNIGGDLDPGDRSAYTSPTNIGAYMWSAVVARDTGLISDAEARERIAVTLETLPTLERHEDSGMFFNWYDPATGAKLTTWPENGDPVHPFLSSVDNGWLATGLEVVKDQVPALAAEADAVVKEMDFGYYYNPAENQIRGGFWVDPPPGCSVPGNYRGGETVHYTCHHYGTLNTEPRIASYIGIAAGQILGVHMVGQEAGEVITAATYALTAGFTVQQLAATRAPFLTMAESLRIVTQLPPATTMDREPAKD